MAKNGANIPETSRYIHGHPGSHEAAKTRGTRNFIVRGKYPLVSQPYTSLHFTRELTIKHRTPESGAFHARPAYSVALSAPASH